MREIYDLNRKWAFTKQADKVPEKMPERWDFVNLPHTWNNIDGQDGGNDYYRGTCYYAKEIEKQELPEADCYFLQIEGANSSADVYLNGELLAHHDGGYSTWRVNLTDKLVHEKNLLVIKVDNSSNDCVYPQKADFTFYGGLYRNVSIIAVAKSHFDLEYYGGPGIQVTPKIQDKDAKVEIAVYLTDVKEGQELLYKIRNQEGKDITGSKVYADNTKIVLDIPSVHLWHGTTDPYLYTAEVDLMQGEEVIDRVWTLFGCRTFDIDPDRGFILNGEEYPLRGVSRHQDRWGYGNALMKAHHKEDMDLIMEMGVNTIRLAHYQHDQYFYDLCDSRGMVVWAEIPYISEHMTLGRDNTVHQMKELIIQNYNHPSIVVWGLSNEITMAHASDVDLLENHEILNKMAHEMDPTRQTVIAAVSMCDIHDPYLQIPDVVSYNHYFGWYGGDVSMNGPWFDHFHETFPRIPIGVSEYGCEALDWHTSDPMQGDYTEEYQAYYHEELIKQLFTRKYLWATHVWNMFDFGADARNEGGENGQNHKGLVTFDRSYRKDAFFAYKAWLSKEPFVHLCGKRYIDRVEPVTKVTVYSNQPEVELFVNGESIGKKKSDDHFFRFEVQNTGHSHLLAQAGECRDESLIIKVDTFNEDYRLKEQGAILNWFDITAPDGYFSLNDRVDEIMASKEGSEVFHGFMSQMTSQMKREGMAGFEMNDNMMKMMGGFTVIRLTNLLATAGMKTNKEQLLELNTQLNHVKKS